jgi:hypothetical protein
MEDRYFYITRVHREDLRGKFTDEEIASLTDDDMEEIADKMADAYLDDLYWVSLEAAAEIVLEDKKQ